MILGILWFLCILRFLWRHLELRLELGRPRSRAEQRIKALTSSTFIVLSSGTRS